jgi:hypothetical protein
MGSDWTKIKLNRDQCDSITKAGIPTGGLMAFGTSWVPKWVADAIRLYSQHQSDGIGYAGMTLTEFLMSLNVQK